MQIKNLKFVPVKGGTFTMGNIPERDGVGFDDERPAHEVTLDDFEMSEAPITVAQYADFLNAYKSTVVKDGEYKGSVMISLSHTQLDDQNGYWVAKPGHENKPITQVTWFGANAFAEFYGCELPTEEQWEFAARGGVKSKEYKYAGSNDLNEVGWYYDNSDSELQNVKLKKPNELELYDMSGNVWEWCKNMYQSYTAKLKSRLENNRKS